MAGKKDMAGYFPVRTVKRAIAAVFLVGIVVGFLGEQHAWSQAAKSSAAPYASIAKDGESYAGPGGSAAYDVRGPVLRIGLLAALHGPGKPDGAAMVAAARLALRNLSARLPSGQRMELVVGDESGPSWGHVAKAVMQLALEHNSLVLITPESGAEAHLTEQVGNRLGIPVLTISGDPTTTEGDIPWIFRLGASDHAEAREILQTMHGGAGSMLLVAEKDEDGVEGARAVDESARKAGLPVPAPVMLDPLRPDYSSVVQRLTRGHFQALVVWTRAATAGALLKRLRAAGISIPTYLSQQAAQPQSGFGFPLSGDGGRAMGASESVLAPKNTGASQSARSTFIRQYVKTTGILPSPAALEIYDAVQLTVRAVQAVGPNRDRIRKYLAGVQNFHGVSGAISFDSQGNCRTRLRLMHLIEEEQRPATGDMHE
jgi:branched-chain amino acid transport system substrate-binding protein